MFKAFDHIRGTRGTEPNRLVGQNSEVHCKGHYGPFASRLDCTAAAAAVSVRSSNQEQAPSSREHGEADALHDARVLLRARSEQQVQQLQISGTETQMQPEFLQQLDGSQSVPIGGRPSAAVLGSRPGVVWHVRRNSNSRHNANASSTAANGYWTTKSSNSGQVDWSAQYAAAAILDAFGSMDVTGSSSSNPSSVQSSTEEVDAAGDLHHQLQRQQHVKPKETTEAPVQHQAADIAHHDARLVSDSVVDYQLLDRRSSHAATRTSDTQLTSGWPSQAAAGSSSRSEQTGRLSDLEVFTFKHAAAAAVAVEDLLYMQQGPAANFRDPRFEMALSRWIKEAPDWLKVRTVYERFGWRFNIVNFSCTLSKLATLLEPLSARRLLPKEQTALRRFLSTVLSSVGELLPSVDAGTAAAVLLSYSKLMATNQVRKNSQFIASLLEHIRPQLCTLQPRELAGCLWALQALQHRPPVDWLDELYCQTEGTVSQLRGDEVAVLLKGLAGVQASCPSSSWLSAVLAHAEQQLKVMEPKHMAMMLMGLAYLQVRPSRSWMEAAISAMRSKLDQMGPQALSNILWALAKMGCLPDRPWLNSYFNTTLLLLNSMNPRELSVDMWSVNALKLEPSDEWLDEYFDQTETKLLGFTLRDLALCGYSLAKLGLRPPQTWLRRYCTLLLRLKAGLWRNKKLLTQVLVALDSFKVPRMDMWRRELYSAAGYKLYKYPDWRQRVKVVPSPAAPYSMWPYSSKRRRFSRRGSGLSSSGIGAAGRVSQGLGSAGPGSVPVTLRSGDWGVMDAMGGGRGVMGSVLSSYEELGTVSLSSTGEPIVVNGSAVARIDTIAAGGSVGSAWSSREDSSSSNRIKTDDIAAIQGRPAGDAERSPAVASVGRARGTAAQRPAGMLSVKGWSGSKSGVAPPRRPLSTAGLVRPPPPPPPAPAAELGEATAPAAAADNAAQIDQPAVSRSSQLQQQAAVPGGADISADLDSASNS